MHTVIAETVMNALVDECNKLLGGGAISRGDGAVINLTTYKTINTVHLSSIQIRFVRSPTMHQLPDDPAEPYGQAQQSDWDQ